MLGKRYIKTRYRIFNGRKKGELIISPGPFLVFKEGDNILIVGEEEILKNVDEFLKR